MAQRNRRRLRTLTTPAGDLELADMLHDGGVLDLHRLGLEEIQRAASAFIVRKRYRDMFRCGQATV